MTLAVKPGARLRAGRYELERLLGRGGAASVWLAQDTLLERPVAIKLLSEGLAADKDWMARFRREARIAAGLQHRNLVSIYDFEAEAERPFLVMAYLPGGSLADKLEHGGCPDSERLAKDVLRAVEHIHAAGIIHRDVKPANVLLDREGRACLTDFGIARPEDATSITQAGQIPGTVRYMAPELWQGKPASERSDLFACGVLLAQCVAADDGAPGRLLGLVERLAAEDPELRPAGASEALAILERGSPALDEPTPTAPTAVAPVQPSGPADPDEDREPTRATAVAVGSAPAPPTSSAARRPAMVALAVVALAVLAAVIGALSGGSEQFEPAPRGASAGAAANGGDKPGDPGRSQAGEQPGSGSGAPAAAPASAADLNDDGFALIEQGSPEQAIPILQQAVDSFEPGTTDLTYAYALYNLGHALRLAGRPAEAIPILEQRLEIPNQTEVVEAELKLAEEDLKAQEKVAKEAEKETGD